MASPDAIADDDDYMRMLEAEAEDSTVDQGISTEDDNIIQGHTAEKAERTWPGECNYTVDILPPDLVEDEFSSYLKQCVMASFTFYRRLEPGAKSLI
jgi:hypothetical protein